MGLFSFITSSSGKSEGDKMIRQLERSGYFKYTDVDKLTELKEELKKSFYEKTGLTTVNLDDSVLPVDHRLYFCDGESLFENYGIEEYLGYAKHAFEKRGLKMTWENEISKEKGDYWDHRITVNGKEYVAFRGNMERCSSWGIAQLNFYNLLNDQLKIQKSKEIVFPIAGGEDAGQYAILTQKQCDFIFQAFYRRAGIREQDRIYPVGVWQAYQHLI